MARFSVCVEMFWKDDPYEVRVEKAAALGFRAAEFWSWKGKAIDRIAAAAGKGGLQIAAFCMTSDRPLVAPGAAEALAAGLRETAAAARRLGTDRLILTTGNLRAKERFAVTKARVIRHLRGLAPLLEESGLTLLVEPLNTVVDHHGYWLETMADAVDICEAVGSPRVRILMDLYHQQIQEGNLIHALTEYAPWIGHYHCAGVPGRNELTGGELDYRGIFKAIDATGYDGWVGLEFRPTIGDEAALRQALELV
jgi:hydroxypyruvate isomerase